MTVHFYTYSKRANSTARPINPVFVAVSTKLKDESGVLSPVLEISNGATWNPSALNYAWIGDYNRYYFVSDWTYIGGRWECSLKVDVLASWKTEIGALSKYILRSASDYNTNIVDDFYPVSTQNRTHFDRSANFGFSQNLNSGGTYILGLANRDTYGAGAITYYALSSSTIRSLVRYMLVGTTDQWDNITAIATDLLERSFYAPFDYIKSCKWFPVSVTSGMSSTLIFGNFDSGISAPVMPLDASSWGTYSRDIALPTSWNSMQAKYRVAPYAYLYLTFNPFGIIELDPYEFNFYDYVRLKLKIDYISGDALLEIYRYDSATQTENFVTQRIAKIGIDINLSATSIDVGGILTGAASAVGAIAGTVATGGAGAIAVGVLGATAGINNMVASATPTASTSVGQTSSGARFYDGAATLRYRCKGFVLENIAEFGRPLMATRTINTLTGFVKCGDGECSIPAFDAEIEEISEHLTNGFFYE